MLRQFIPLPMALILASAAPLKVSPAAEMLQKLATLQGEWKGQFAWTGARHESGEIAARYSVAKFKGAVFENLLLDGTPYMTSVYHLDGPDLRVTHFCVQSQPRLKADQFDPASLTAHFSLVDVTNAGPTSGYVEEIRISRPANDRLDIEFLFKGNGPKSIESIHLKRAV